MEEEISLEELVGILKKRLGMIISLGLLGLILAAGFTFFVATPQYSSATQLLVNRTTNQSEGLQLNDINRDVQMINTYKDIIKGPVILDKVREEMSSDLTSQQLANKITIATQDNSQVFSIAVQDEDPFIAAKIANQLADTFKNEVGNIMNVDNVTIISEAAPNTKQVSPNNMLNLAIGLLIGLMLGVGIAFLLEFMDKTVRDERFITETVGWANIGEISQMSREELSAPTEYKKTGIASRKEKSRV